MSDHEHENKPNTNGAEGAQDANQSEPHEPAKLDHASPLTEAMRTHGEPRVTKRGNPMDPPDRGNAISRIVAIVATIFVVAFVVLWQNTPDSTLEAIFFGKTTPEEIKAPQADQPAPGNFGQVDIMGRLFLRGLDMFKQHDIMSQIEAPGMMFIEEDRVRLVMISAEFEDTDTALQRLESLRLELLGFDEPEDPDEIALSTNDLVLQEIDILRTLYTQGAQSLSDDQTQQLKDRYGYIGHVALSHELPSTDETRQKLTSGFGKLMLFLIMMGLIIVLGPLLGIVLLVLGIVQFSTGRMKMRTRIPTPGGSVYLETYALFVFGFCIMAVSTFLIQHSAYPEFAAFSLLAQWLLLATIFWALMRGTKFHEWKQSIGWNSGEGVLKEIGCGIIAYIASLPVYIAGVIVTMILLILKEMLQTQANGGVPLEPVPVTNPIFEMVAQGDLFVILFLFVLATTWAPIVEESIFRGALYRHFRARIHWVPAGIFTAILFAFMHDYGPLMVAPLIALGFMFAFMREWRGSLIAPVTAHFLHNFSLMTFMIVLVQLIKDPVG
jgi:membrane protease YdiL (CAAX protease family)